MLRSSRWVLPTLLAALSGASRTLHAQWQSNTGSAGAALGATVGGDVERYLRALILSGVIESLPWAVRPFGPSDVRAVIMDSSQKAHPWRTGLRVASGRAATLGAMGFVSANTGFAWGANDGALWQGRGLTVAGGVAASTRWGPFSAVAAPVAFLAQNADIPRLLPSPTGSNGDPLFYNNVDLPLEMGAKAYGRIDPGESTLRLDLGSAVLGISSASLGWGVGDAFPALFGPNAGGFSHIFAGTKGRGLRIPRIGKFSGRYVLGVLEQTRWSPVQGSESYLSAEQPGTRRLATGLVVSFMPALLSNLELGANRFYHSPYLSGGERWAAWSRPFDGIFKESLPPRIGPVGEQNGDLDNQMASFFARLVFPGRGVEAGFELFREDYNWDLRDLAQEPENNSAVIATLHAMTERRADRLSVLSLEYFDGNVRPIAQARGQGALYVHGTLRQGHTQRGQLLGSPVGVGAIGGSRISWERFTPSGSLRIMAQRWRPRSSFQGTRGDGLYPPADQPIAYAKYHDWIIDGSVASTQYRGRSIISAEVGLAWAGVWQLTERRTNLYARISVGAF